MAVKARMNPLTKTSSYVFLLGVIIAVIAGLAFTATKNMDQNTQAGVAGVLVVLGAVVGLMSASGLGTIGKQEMANFLTASIALVVSGAGAAIFSAYVPLIGTYIAGVVALIAVFVVPIAVIVALKSVWDIGTTF